MPNTKWVVDGQMIKLQIRWLDASQALTDYEFQFVLK